MKKILVQGQGDCHTYSIKNIPLDIHNKEVIWNIQNLKKVREESSCLAFCHTEANGESFVTFTKPKHQETSNDRSRFVNYAHNFLNSKSQASTSKCQIKRGEILVQQSKHQRSTSYEEQ